MTDYSSIDTSPLYNCGNTTLLPDFQSGYNNDDGNSGSGTVVFPKPFLIVPLVFAQIANIAGNVNNYYSIVVYNVTTVSFNYLKLYKEGDVDPAPAQFEDFLWVAINPTARYNNSSIALSYDFGLVNENKSEDSTRFKLPGFNTDNVIVITQPTTPPTSVNTIHNCLITGWDRSQFSWKKQLYKGGKPEPDPSTPFYWIAFPGQIFNAQLIQYQYVSNQPTSSGSVTYPSSFPSPAVVLTQMVKGADTDYMFTMNVTNWSPTSNPTSQFNYTKSYIHDNHTSPAASETFFYAAFKM